MQLLVLIPSFFIFLFCLYKLVKDDYVFIRRNISPEQFFDITFLVVWISLFTSRAFSIFLDPKNNQPLLQFSSPTNGNFSSTGGVIGGLLALYVIARYKRIPLGRLTDFYSLAFLIALPIGFMGSLVLSKNLMILLSGINAGLYFIIMIIFFKILYSKMIKRTLKEGTITIFFLMYFSLASFVTSFLGEGMSLMNGQNILLMLLFLFNLVLLFRQELSNKFRLHRKYP